MKQRKNTHEVCDGYAFSTQVISGYVRKTTILCRINRSLQVRGDKKTMAIKKENG